MAFIGARQENHRYAHVTHTERDPMSNMEENNEDLLTSHANICACIPFIGDKAKQHRAALKKERIRQFSIWHFEMEDQREDEHIKRRRARKDRAKTFANMSSMKKLRMLYILTILTFIAGLVITFCSTVKSIGELTPLYKQREIYRIIGPLVLGLTLLLYMLATGLRHKMLKSSRKPKFSFYYMDKNEKGESQKISFRKGQRHSVITNDSGTVEDIEMSPLDNPRHADDVTSEAFILPRQGGLDTNSPVHWPGVAMVSGGNMALDKSEWDRRHQRLAWAKTKWMRMDSRESADTWADSNTDDIELELGHTDDSSFPPEDSVTDELTSSYDSCRVRGHSAQKWGFSRDMSVKSKDSHVSNFSNFSESAQLIKK